MCFIFRDFYNIYLICQAMLPLLWPLMTIEPVEAENGRTLLGQLGLCPRSSVAAHTGSLLRSVTDSASRSITNSLAS